MNALAMWTVIVAIVSSVPCAVLGCYLVLRRLSLLGDAISHAVLPGLAIGFLLTGSLIGWPILLGAAAAGLLTAVLTQGVHRLANVPEDASMGVVFTSLFAIGVILVSRAASKADLDPGCVLYGLIEFVPLDTVPVFGMEVPRALLTQLPMLALTVGFVTVLWKELKAAAFDPALAGAMGLRPDLVHYLLMAMVACVTVAAFEAVGSILVIAMLIVPPATAHLLTDRLARMVWWSAAMAALASVLGYLGAERWNTSVAGMMAVAAGAQFLIAALVSPRHGVVAKIAGRARLALRIARQDVLADLFRREESEANGVVVARDVPRVGVSMWVWRWAVCRLASMGLVRREGGRLQLTDAGRARARELIRSHRLWESYLSTRLDLPPDHLHEAADRMEHFTSAELRDELASELADPGRDPHGRPIPGAP